MALSRAVTAVQQAVLSNIRIAPATLQSANDCVFSRFFAKKLHLDRNEVTDRVIAALKNFEKVDPNKVTTSSSFKDLGLDSLDTVEVVMAMEEDFSIEMPDEDADKIMTVEDAVEYFANHPHAK